MKKELQFIKQDTGEELCGLDVGPKCAKYIYGRYLAGVQLGI
jgi:hypothetical protein